MTETHTLQLKIDAAAAKRGSREFTNAIAAVKAAVRGLEKDTDGTFTKLRSGVKVRVDTADMDRAATSTRAGAKALTAFERENKRVQLSAASAMRTSQSQADRLYEKLSRLGDTAGISKLTVDLAKLQSRLSTATSALDVRSARSHFADTASGIMQTNRALELQERASNIASTATASHASQLESLRAKYSPLFSASMQYETALREIADAERLGAISSAQATQARDRAAQALSGQTAIMDKNAKAMGASKFNNANIAAQLQDIAVTAQMGMNPLQIALQQGTQLSAVFGTMSGGVLPGLKAAFLSVVSPVSLVTVGVIAGGAALLQFAGGAFASRDAVKELEDRMSSLKSLTTDLSASTDILKLTMGELSEKYGAAATKVQELAVLQAGLRISELNGQMKEQTNILARAANGYYSAVQGGWQYHETIQRLRSQLSLSVDDARAFDAALREAATGATLDDQIAGLRRVNDILNENNVDVSLLPPELAKAVIQVIDLSNETDAAKKVADDLATSVSTIAPRLDPAVTTAVALKTELAAALTLMNKIANQDSKEYSGRGADPRTFMPGGKNAYGPADMANYVDIDEIIADAKDKATRAAGGSRKSRASGGSKPKISEEARERERLTDRIQDQVEALKNEADAASLVATGRFETVEAARLWAEVEAANAGAVDGTTAAMIAQIDAMEALKASRSADPIQQYLDQLGTAEQRTRNLKATLLQQTEGTLADIFAGEFDAGQMVSQLKRTLAQKLAQDVMGKLVPGMSTDIGQSVAMVLISTQK